MEVEDIQQATACKFPRIGNGRNDSGKIGSKGVPDHYPDDEEDGELNRVGPGSDAGGNVNRLRGWNHSRIIRVPRASGGKDRHSKVWTSKGLRDRRVRLSVTTAIQFYDLQDRLGVDQPSKAVEWLIKAAADSIAELPSLNTFPDTPKQLSDEKRANGGTEQGFDSAAVELDGDPNFQNQSQHLSLSKSACSSTSETSKGSGLSLSRSEIRVKARERARERAAKEKEKEIDSRIAQNVNQISHNASFTELLTGGISSVNNNANSPTRSAHQNPGCEANLFHKAAARQWTGSTPMDYFDSGLLGPSSRAHHSSGFSGQIHLGNSLPMTMSVPAFNLSGDNHSELQHFSFVPDPLIPVASATSQPGGGPVDYNLNFTISSGQLAGYNNRGTLQSNSPSLLPHLQRFSPIDGPNVPFFMASAPSASLAMENHHHHQFSPGIFDGRLQLSYGDASRHSEQKGKGKN
ncbi:hypothetical protein F2P56_009228 [Juglans regia]|uniref:Transcription factor TCP2-like n=2 Tax=Juglans regia TaxID=51240 RepID=A0A2I4EJY3_JUGRE|nr:transcription factor TCP2-like [Juglans regia]XP_018819704.1 transcription factor TCP2-like [Juglans regia]XP_018819705.1 transcription factor TCP2-like [Juglans regia]XP_018819706.1 transcription factor TCP2-like [Juglans regia]XP_035545475.1 transcription factor TCP2-like [Juglans regia]XP_035545476.1 transcription factor TCP2-like [Juglans regia]XP_035545477.1 transcription factor TCP2-like [Juglans regia]KAF5472515.1 hypothetical protein F2P56_009228 [Juglans regia]